MCNVNQSFTYPSIKAACSDNLSDYQHKADAFVKHVVKVSSDRNYTDELQGVHRQYSDQFYIQTHQTLN